jgi:hypothetical protein
MTHNQSMSTDSFSPIIHSSSSLSTDDNYETSSPVNDDDEIVIRRYPADPAVVGYEDHDGMSLWHDLDRDGVNTPAIPSFILNSPPLGPVRNSRKERMSRKDHPEVSTHSLRKGISLCKVDVGRDPKFFFGESVGESTLNAEATTYIPETDLALPEDQAVQYTRFGYHSGSPSTTSVTVNNDIWSNDVSGRRYIPAQGPWGIIPSRSIMISNLPKTTQLWTLVELVKVSLLVVADNRVWVIGLGFLRKRFIHMELLLCHSMIFAMECVVFGIFAMTISFPIVVLIRILFQT